MSQLYPTEEYNTLVFDCDGVVLDSNRIKTQAFHRSTLPYGKAAAQAMVNWHTANGGVSRYKKFAYFLDQILPLHAEHPRPEVESLLDVYSAYVRDGLLRCDLASGLEELRQRVPHACWMIVSGGDQAELREIFVERGIAEWFDGGIFGSPDVKEEILARELSSGAIQPPALFVGDSKYDYKAARATGLCFVFLSGWTEVADWHSWAVEEGIAVKENIRALAGAGS